MTGAARALLWPAAVTALVFALLVGLGVWQLQRLEYKQALIARIEARASAPPQDPPPRAKWAALSAQDIDFLHVRANGRFLAGSDALIFSPPPEGANREPGYLVLTPLALEGGGVLLVDRGFLPASKVADPALRAPPAGTTALSGLLRAPESRNAFTPKDEPSRGVFFTRDPAAIAAALGLTESAPFTLSLEAAPDSAGGPRPVPGAPAIVNNHLSYALTWFGLSIALVVIFVLYARGSLARGAASKEM